jgi:DNA-binding Lrp family transcriptional regulator
LQTTPRRRQQAFERAIAAISKSLFPFYVFVFVIGVFRIFVIFETRSNLNTYKKAKHAGSPPLIAGMGCIQMINAYILINIRVGKIGPIVKALQKIEKLDSIAVVAGEYDIVVRLSAEQLEDLLEVTDQIQMLEGIVKTNTQIVEKEIAV